MLVSLSKKEKEREMDNRKKEYMLIDGSECGGGSTATANDDNDEIDRELTVKSPDSISDYSLFNFKNHKVSTLTYNNRPPSSSSSSIINQNNKNGGRDYTIAGRTQQQSRFSKYYYHQVGTFLTQYKIRENYKFLQMISVPPLDPQTPKPEGAVSVPACGEPLLVPHSFPQSIEAGNFSIPLNPHTFYSINSHSYS